MADGARRRLGQQQPPGRREAGSEQRVTGARRFRFRFAAEPPRSPAHPSATPRHPRGSEGRGGGRRGAHAQHPAPLRARRYRAGGRDEGGSGTAHAHCIPEASPRPRRPGGCHGNGACAAPQQPRALGREMEARAALRLPHPTPAALLSPGARVLGSSIPAARGAACLSVCAHPTERLLQHASSSMPQALKHAVNNYHNNSKT